MANGNIKEAAPWVAIGLTVAVGLIGYGSIKQTVQANEEALKAAQSTPERLATVETKIEGVQKDVSEVKEDVDTINKNVDMIEDSMREILIELQRQAR